MPKAPFSIYHIDNQLFTILIIGISVLVFTCSCNTTSNNSAKEDTNLFNQPSDLEILKTPVNFTLMLNRDSAYRTMAFYKAQDSSTYTSFNYQLSLRNETILSEEVKHIDYLWSIADDSISIGLKSIMIGYPLEYRDVLKRHIVAFQSSTIWQEKKDLPIDQTYKLVREVMLASNVYKPIDSLISLYGYRAVSLHTEKHGYVTPQKLVELGFESELKIPVPFLVWFEVEKI